MTKIISTLPIKYKGFRQAWISTPEDKQTLSNLTARLLDEEASVTVQEEHDNALATTSSGYSSKNRKYTIKCYKCHHKGHLIRDCRSKPKEADDENKDKKFKESNDGRKYNKGRHSNYTAFSSETCASSLTDVESWILDSGASNHMTGRKKFFSTFEAFCEESFVRLGNNMSLPVKGKGNVKIRKFINRHDSIIQDVLFVPDLKKNLFSERKLIALNMETKKSRNRAQIYRNGKLIAWGERQSNLYKMLFKTVISEEANTTTQSSLEVWHKRLGHLNTRAIKEIISRNLRTGVNLDSHENFFLPRLCIR